MQYTKLALLMEIFQKKCKTAIYTYGGECGGKKDKENQTRS
jgi:hypothetical protein